MDSEDALSDYSDLPNTMRHSSLWKPGRERQTTRRTERIRREDTISDNEENTWEAANDT